MIIMLWNKRGRLALICMRNNLHIPRTVACALALQLSTRSLQRFLVNTGAGSKVEFTIYKKRNSRLLLPGCDFSSEHDFYENAIIEHKIEGLFDQPQK